MYIYIYFFFFLHGTFVTRWEKKRSLTSYHWPSVGQTLSFPHGYSSTTALQATFAGWVRLGVCHGKYCLKVMAALTENTMLWQLPYKWPAIVMDVDEEDEVVRLTSFSKAYALHIWTQASQLYHCFGGLFFFLSTLHASFHFLNDE